MKDDGQYDDYISNVVPFRRRNVFHSIIELFQPDEGWTTVAKR